MSVSPNWGDHRASRSSSKRAVITPLTVYEEYLELRFVRSFDPTFEPKKMVGIRRLEVITGVGGRRTWSDEDKGRIVAASRLGLRTKRSLLRADSNATVVRSLVSGGQFISIYMVSAW